MVTKIMDPKTKKELYSVSNGSGDRKLFYHNPRILIDDYQITTSALKTLLSIQRKPSGVATLVKPIVIANVKGDVTPVEIRSLAEALNDAGAREVIITN